MQALIGALRATLGMDSAGFERGADRALAKMTSVERGMRRMGASLQRSGRRLSASLTAPVVGFTTLMVRSSLVSVDAQAKMAESLDTSVVSLQNLERAAELAGISQSDLNGSLERMTRRISLAEQGMGPAADALDRLGLSAEELNDIPADERVQLITSAIRDMVPEAEQAGEASKIFGDRTGMAIMRLNPKVIEQAAREVREFGVGVSDVDADNIELVNDSMSKMKMAVEGLANQITVVLAPVILEWSEKLADVARAFNELEPETKAFIGKIIVAAAAIGPALLAFGLLSSALAPIAGAIAAILSPMALLVVGVGLAAGAIWRNWDRIAEEFPALAAVVEGAVSVLKDVIVAAFNTIEDTLRDIEAFVAATAQFLDDVFSGDWAAAFDSGADLARAGLNLIFSLFNNLLGGLPKRALQWGRETIARWWSAIQERWVSFRQGLQGLWDDLVAWIGQWPEKFFEVGQGIIDRMIDGVISRLPVLRGAIDQAGDTLASGGVFGGGGGGLGGAGDSGGEYGGFLPPPPPDQSDAFGRSGADAGAGFAEGLSGTQGQARSAGAGIGAAAEEGLRDRLDIQSPSRVMMQLGRFLVDGFTLGIDRNGGQAVGAAASLSDQVTEAMRLGDLDKLSSALDSAASGVGSIDDSLSRLGDTGAQTFERMGATLGDLLTGARSFRDVLSSGLGNLSQQLRQSAMGDIGAALTGSLGNVGGGLLSGLVGNLMGFANGGSFQVGGTGGIDSQVVAFRASPDERVTITRPDQEISGGAGAGGTMTVNINLEGANGDAAIEAAVERGVRVGIDSYDRRVLPARVGAIVKNPRKTG